MGIVERKEREREARRTAILEAAAAVFKSKGFANATMEEIAREAELAKGTIYLYYKSKEELQIGLVIRGMEFMGLVFKEATDREPTAFAKLQQLPAAYWEFAATYPFYFGVMQLMDIPQNEELVSSETIQGLHEQSNGIWTEIVMLIEQAKRDGFVREDVDAFAFAMLLWMNTTSTLRFHYKILNQPNSVWKGEGEYNPCDLDFRKLYDLNAGLLFHQIVTDAGRRLLSPVEWPHTVMPTSSPEPALA